MKDCNFSNPYPAELTLFCETLTKYVNSFLRDPDECEKKGWWYVDSERATDVLEVAKLLEEETDYDATELKRLFSEVEEWENVFLKKEICSASGDLLERKFYTCAKK